jgi:hypothetical protein
VARHRPASRLAVVEPMDAGPGGRTALALFAAQSICAERYAMPCEIMVALAEPMRLAAMRLLWDEGGLSAPLWSKARPICWIAGGRLFARRPAAGHLQTRPEASNDLSRRLHQQDQTIPRRGLTGGARRPGSGFAAFSGLRQRSRLTMNYGSIERFVAEGRPISPCSSSRDSWSGSSPAWRAPGPMRAAVARLIPENPPWWPMTMWCMKTRSSAAGWC